ncbi:hypothetical protein NLI96_g12444 [Meripilus lineatus]|uniref:Uncharacterized protein n=1 Tax=Meripilus lineatus TaxID=2056292 RepID=A0AAD5UR99_9APHY|nr:hypothetical protein NLI96_g12444 [Physisporinus lineatus]
MANRSERTALAAPQRLHSKRRRSSSSESPEPDDPQPKHTQTYAQPDPDTEETVPAPSSRRYNLRETNKSNPGRALGVFKRTRDEWLHEQAQKRAGKEAAKGKLTVNVIPKQRSTVLSELSQRYLEEQKEFDVHDYPTHQSLNAGSARQYLSPPPSQIGASDGLDQDESDFGGEGGQQDDQDEDSKGVEHSDRIDTGDHDIDADVYGRNGDGDGDNQDSDMIFDDGSQTDDGTARPRRLARMAEEGVDWNSMEVDEESETGGDAKAISDLEDGGQEKGGSRLDGNSSWEIEHPWEVPPDVRDWVADRMDTSEDEEPVKKKVATAKKKDGETKTAGGHTDISEDKQPVKKKKLTPAEKKSIEVRAARELAFGEKEETEENRAKQTPKELKEKQTQKQKQKACVPPTFLMARSSALQPDWRGSIKKPAPAKKATHRRQDSNLVGGFNDDDILQGSPTVGSKNGSQKDRQMVEVVPYKDAATRNDPVPTHNVPPTTTKANRAARTPSGTSSRSQDPPAATLSRQPANKALTPQESRNSRMPKTQPIVDSGDEDSDHKASKPDTPAPSSNCPPSSQRRVSQPRNNNTSISLKRKLLAASSKSQASKSTTRRSSTSATPPVNKTRNATKPVGKSVKKSPESRQVTGKARKSNKGKQPDTTDHDDFRVADWAQDEADLDQGSDSNVKSKVVRGEFDDWQRELSKDTVFRATVIEFFGMLKDPWINKISTTKLTLVAFIQHVVDCIFAEKEFTVTADCLLIQNVCIFLSDWRSYFFKSSSHVVVPFFTDENLGLFEVIEKDYNALDPPAIAALAEKSIDNGTALFSEPDPDPDIGQTSYILETFVSAHQKKIEGSRLWEIYDPKTLTFPFGALELATYAVHIAFQQFVTGRYIKGRFSKKTNVKLWTGHCANIRHELSREDRRAFLVAVNRYQPQIVRAQRHSTAFTTVRTLKSRKSGKNKESGSDSAREENELEEPDMEME